MNKSNLIPRCVEVIKKAGNTGLTPHQIQAIVGTHIPRLSQQLSRWAHEHRDIQVSLQGLWYVYRMEQQPEQMQTFRKLEGYNLDQGAHREGSLDYRKWPARVGGRLIDYQPPRSAA